MQENSSTLYVTKLAAAGRQLNAAIRMFFAREDELAIHTVASAAFRILRDLTKKRGKRFGSEIAEAGFYAIAKEYAEGRLPTEVLKAFEDSPEMRLIEEMSEDIRSQGDQFDRSRIKVPISQVEEQLIWPTRAANFLKHADRDAEALLPINDLSNELVIGSACAAYLRIIFHSTPEIVAFHVYACHADRSDFVSNLGDDAKALLEKVRTAKGEDARFRLCSKFISEERKRHR